MVSCSPAELKLENDGKREKVKGYELILKDTILFPEGGGQVRGLFLLLSSIGEVFQNMKPLVGLLWLILFFTRPSLPF